MLLYTKKVIWRGRVRERALGSLTDIIDLIDAPKSIEQYQIKCIGPQCNLGNE